MTAKDDRLITQRAALPPSKASTEARQTFSGLHCEPHQHALHPVRANTSQRCSPPSSFVPALHLPARRSSAWERAYIRRWPTQPESRWFACEGASATAAPRRLAGQSCLHMLSGARDLLWRTRSGFTISFRSHPDLMAVVDATGATTRSSEVTCQPASQPAWWTRSQAKGGDLPQLAVEPRSQGS